METKSLKCQACSAYLTYDKIIKAKAKSDHMKSSTHRRAMQSWAPSTDSVVVSRAGTPKTNPVLLSVAAQFNETALDDEMVSIPEFQTLVLTEEGIYDEDNTKIMLSAGRSVADNSRKTWQGIQNVAEGRETIPLTHPPSVTFEDELNVVDWEDWDEQGESYGVDKNNRWFPYENQTMFFLDLLDNLPRLRLSDDHLKAVLWVMKECGTPNVPSFYKLRKTQDKLRTGYLKTEEHTSISGDKFFMNNPVDIIRLVSQENTITV